MKSVTTERFRKALYLLPFSVRALARKSYDLWINNPYHPSLNFKQIHPDFIYLVRIGLSYRALGKRDDDTMIWFWIVSHEDYNNLISRL